MSLTFMHAADFHLGADLRRFGAAAEKIVDAQFDALEKTLAHAADNDVAFLIICGDLFDNRNPSLRTVHRTRELFEKYRSVKTYILPGTHDFLADNSVYSQTFDIWNIENVVVLNQLSASPYNLPGTDDYFYYCPNQSNRSGKSPISGFVHAGREGHHIGLAHGSLNLGGIDFSYDYPIGPEQIRKCGLDYLALGHWHRCRIEKFNRTTAAYPGIPQPLSFSDPEKGSVFRVNIMGPNEVTVDPVQTSSISFKKVNPLLYHPEELKRILERESACPTVIKLDISYSDNFKEFSEVDEIIACVKPRFIFMQSGDRNEQTPKPGFSGLAEIESSPLVRAFLGELERLRESEGVERADIYEKAAKLGVRIIRGEI